MQQSQLWLRALRKISKTSCRLVTTGLFKAWIGKVNHVYYDLFNTNCVLWLLHITFVAVCAYVVCEGGCGCCVRACMRVGMGMHMHRLACRSGIHDLTYVQMGGLDGWAWMGLCV